jgi:hypothetical protein
MQLIEDFFSLSDDVRYVALYLDGELVTASRPGTVGASSSESDKVEELIVNPALLTLVKQRGDIDCGGARYVLVRYGNFYQLIAPIRNGHVSICLEPHADPLRPVEPVQSVMSRHGLQ